MKWLILIAAVVATALALWILAGERRRGGRRSTGRQLAAAIASLVVLGAAVYAAHYIGFFSLPIVAVAFVPFGLAARWSILATRGARERIEAARPAVPPSRGARLRELAMWPLFAALVTGVALLGLVAGLLAARH
jgi:hypothetical protein